MTTNEIAELFRVSPATARLWCETGKFPNAYKEQTPFGAYWKIPDYDLTNFQAPLRGRPRLQNPSSSALSKRKQREKRED